jgi:hypothetical protein
MFLTLDSTVGNVSVRNISRRTVDLNGPEGNAFYLLGLVQSTAKQLMLQPSTIQSQMISGDYFNLVATFEAYFGDFFYLILTDEMDENELSRKAEEIRKEAYRVQD